MLDALQRRRPGHATVVAYVALFVALGGTGYATTAARSTGKEANERPRATLRQTASTPPRAVGGAYGVVDKNGALSRSRWVSAVSHPSEGVYCIKLDSGNPSTTGLVVTPDFSDDSSNFTGTPTSSRNHAIAEWRSSAANCPGRLEVNTAIQRSDGSVDRRNQGFFFSVPAAPAVYFDSTPFGGFQGIFVDSVMAQVDLPAGTYALIATIDLRGGRNDSDKATGSCGLGPPDEPRRYAHSFWDLGGEKKALALQAVRALPSGGSIRLSCSNQATAQAGATSQHLTAIRIG